jgi:hypothetical protein
LHRERPQPVAHLRFEHEARVPFARREVDPLHDRVAAATVLDDAAAEVRKIMVTRERAAVVVDDHVIVVQVGDRASAVRVQAERERTDDERLEVEHQMAADELRRIANAAPQ